MYTYYIFNIKEEFKDLYGDNPSGLYTILNNIRNIKYDEANFGITFLKQLTRKIEKQHLDNYLFIKMHKEAFYSKKENIHYYSDGILNEISNLEIMNSYIRIITNQRNSVFIKYLERYSTNFFICDFRNTNFYFIDRVKTLV